MKVKKIMVKNIRSIDDLSFEFNGCSAIVTGRNSIGKSTFLKFLFDRLSSTVSKKNIVWNESEGMYSLELDDGTIIEYFVKEKDEKISEKLNIIYPDGKKEKLTRDIIKKLYPKQFDIDQFVEMTPKEQLYYVADIIGKSNIKSIVDEIEELRKQREFQYGVFKQKEKAFQENLNNWGLQKIDLTQIQKMKDELKQEKENIEKAKIEKENIINEWNNLVRDVVKKNEELDKEVNQKYLEIKEENLKIQEEVKTINEKIQNLDKKKEDYSKIFNYVKSDFAKMILVKDEKKPMEKDNIITNIEELQIHFEQKINELTSKINELKSKIKSDHQINQLIEELKKSLPYTQITSKPDASKQDEVLEKEKFIYIKESKLKDLERFFLEYNFEKKKYNEYTSHIEEKENELKIQFSSLNNDKIKFKPDGIYYEGKIISKKTLSTSELYKSAIYISSLSLGEIRTIVFDISTFDKNSFYEIIDFAKNNDIQLLVERPDWDANNNKIKIEIIEK